MSVTSDLLFAYLREIFYATPDAKLDVEQLDEDFLTLAKGLMYFSHCFSQYNEFANALARGDLSVSAPPPENELAAPLKSLHASLKHLTWQTQQVSRGDYKQRVDFMGEFAEGFNSMVEQLDDRQKKLENEIMISRKHADALAQSNLLFSNLTHHIPQQIFVIDVEEHSVLLSNEMANLELENDAGYIAKLVALLPDHKEMCGNYYADVELRQDGLERYLAVNAYLIEWNNEHAVALVVKDVSEEKKQILELEGHAYHDALTSTFNRFYGMNVLNEWIGEKRRFSLIFVDMDSLKYINDVHGHKEGDHYIISVARYLKAFSEDAVVCRLGGDEFMVLASDMSKDDAQGRIAEVAREIEGDDYLEGKDYQYSVSVGIVAVDEHNDQPAGVILGLADERMYEHKRARKKERQDARVQH